MFDPLLRRNFVYEVADSFVSTKAKMASLLNEFDSGKMEEEGNFTYRANFMFNPRIFNSYRQQVVQVYWQGMAGRNWKKHSHSLYDCSKYRLCVPYTNPISAMWIKRLFWR